MIYKNARKKRLLYSFRKPSYLSILLTTLNAAAAFLANVIGSSCADSKCIYIAHGSLNNQWLCNAVIAIRRYPSSVSKEFTSSCKKLSEILYHFEPQTGKMGNGQGMRWANKHLTRWQNELPKILANSLRIFCFLPFHAVAPPMSKKNV
ncbi:hypothetical protein NRS6085_13035 [Bacillus subtilis]|nr:hypothetical protein NRS6085_01380 [Bacillus subtilis]CAI6283462.1 hypothetical protein NRS6085_13035 [Bacillus subtilis]